MHDFIGHLYARRHQNHFDPEARLIMVYFGTALMFIALLVLGFALQHTWHYMAIAVFYAVQIVGIVIATTGISAYLLDAYPEGSGEIGAWTNFGRLMGGFMATYVQLEWVQRNGAAVALGSEAAIVFAAALIILGLHVFGGRIRRMQGPMKFATD